MRDFFCLRSLSAAGARPFAGQYVPMGLEEFFQPVRDQADVGSVAIVVVHHDPLPVAQLGYVVADPLERRIEISDETGQHTEARTGADEIAQGPRPVDGCDNPLSGILARPAEIG